MKALPLFLALFPLWLLPRLRRPALDLRLPLALAFLLLWSELGAEVALAALPGMSALFVGGELLYRSGLRLPRWGYGYRWAVLLTLPWALGLWALWFGVLEGQLDFALEGGVLALLGFFPLRHRLEEGWRALSVGADP
ncbi:hypothetical protein [Thermus caldilimi]|uniref:hypothetical protein n=1 Tax=Thermus caldilimi TaxID=2483360 RepID=UPI001076AC73|nr:hypothetical protein [Thermus caldilimi]